MILCRHLVQIFMTATLLSTCSTLAAKTTDCHQNIIADRPVLISSTNGRACSYMINVPANTLPDHVFQLTILAFSFGRSAKRSDCRDNWARLGGSVYCGGPVTPGIYLLFPTSTHHTYLDIDLHPEPSDEFQARIELLPRLALQERHPEMILATPGELIPYTTCDREFKCLQYPGYCQITSPNYPGAYARPMNCSYVLKSHEPGVVIGGRHNDWFEIGSATKMTQNCDNDDHIAVYDGSELISKFCGKGKRFPRIISKTPDIVIIFVAMPTGLPNKGFALSLEQSPPHLTDHVRCSETIRVGNNVQQLKSPHHWLAPNNQCEYVLNTKPGNQIWILFTSFRTKNTCRKQEDYISVYDGKELVTILCKQLKKSFPIVSKSNEVKIIFHSPNGTFDATSKLHYVVRFISVNSIENGIHIPNTWCDMIFYPNNKTHGSFTLLHPKDLILQAIRNQSTVDITNQYQQQNRLICKYHFQAPESYTVRLQLDQATFEPLHRCHSYSDSCISSDKFDKVIASEKLESHVLGCECGTRSGKHSQIFHSKGSEMIISLHLHLNYDLVNTSLKFSPELYQFQGRYKYLPPHIDHLHCGLYTLTNSSLQFPSQSHLYVMQPLLCNWSLLNISLTSVYFNISSDCKHNALYLNDGSNNAIKMCSGDEVDAKLWQDVPKITVYLLVNKGRPRLNIQWTMRRESVVLEILKNVTSQDYDEDNSMSDDLCYSVLTVSLLMILAAIVTTILVIAIVLVLWRYRESVWFTLKRARQQRYSSVTRHFNGAVW